MVTTLGLYFDFDSTHLPGSRPLEVRDGMNMPLASCSDLNTNALLLLGHEVQDAGESQ